jgi:N-acetylmuramoyl-L-alanine amidase
LKYLSPQSYPGLPRKIYTWFKDRPVFALFWLVPTLVLVFSTSLFSAGELARAREARDRLLSITAPLNRSDYLKLISQFEEAASVQPKEAIKAQALLEAAELCLQTYYKFKIKADAIRVEKLARQIIKDCGRCPTAPLATIYLGRSLIVQGLMDNAYRELMKVELNYPDSPEITEARVIMSSLRAGETPPPYPFPVPTVVPATSAPVAGLEPPSPPPPKKPPDTSPTQAPIKAPAPRKDGLFQAYALSLTDLGDYNVITAWVDGVTPYVYNLIPPQKNGGNFRIYVDLRGTRLGTHIPTILKKTTSLVKLVKINQFDENTVRLVVDLPEAYPYTPIFLDNPPRMAIYVAKSAYNLPAGFDAPPQPRPASATPPQKTTLPTQPRGPAESLARQLGLKVRRVVIDAGHGGKDNGATAFGFREKDLALRVAINLKTKIESRLGITAILTRSDDTFVTLERRPKIVVENQGDIFISIHANANTLAAVEGLETYILNFGTDPAALNVASRENASANRSMSEMVQILDVIAKNTKISESLVLAKSVHGSVLESVRKKYKVRDLGVKEAVFLVLVNVNVPAILLEIGFLTNEAEAKRINEELYIDLLTDGIVTGLKAYIDGLAH